MIRNELGTSSRRTIALGFVLESLPEQGGSRGGRGGGVSIGGGIGMGSFGSGGGIGLSLGSGALGSIGGRKQPKPAKIWQELLLARAAPAGK
jgi:hypothetical protein